MPQRFIAALNSGNDRLLDLSAIGRVREREHHRREGGSIIGGKEGAS